MRRVYGAEGFAKAGTLRSEYVVAVEGTVTRSVLQQSMKT